MKSAVILLSGGIDSSTLTYYLYSKGYILYPLCIIYGQKHRREIDSAGAIANSLGLKLQIADLSSISMLFGGSALTSSDISIPEGHYSNKSMKATVVPNRNMVFLSLAAAYALTMRCKYVAYAAHANDRAIYPDCRPEFIESARETIRLGTEKITLIDPFITRSKASIVREGLKLGVPYEDTWSCYIGGEKACGKCGTCCERRGAFELNEVKDPIEYEGGSNVQFS